MYVYNLFIFSYCVKFKMYSTSFVIWSKNGKRVVKVLVTKKECSGVDWSRLLGRKEPNHYTLFTPLLLNDHFLSVTHNVHTQVHTIWQSSINMIYYVLVSLEKKEKKMLHYFDSSDTITEISVKKWWLYLFKQYFTGAKIVFFHSVLFYFLHFFVFKKLFIFWHGICNYKSETTN